MSGPNVLVVLMDTARADAFEPYGAVTGSSPTVGQLARSGAAQEHVFATASWTVPSHASMFSGLQPFAMGLGQAPEGPLGCRPYLEALQPRLLPEVLRRAGYRTRGASTNLWVSDKTGFDLGFDHFEVVPTDHGTKIEDRRFHERVRWAVEAARARQDDGARRVAELMEQWLGDAGPEPFFWFVNLTECHSPYLPPRPYNDLGWLERLRAGDEARRFFTLTEIWKVCLGATAPPAPDALARMRHLYGRSVRYMDDWLAQVLERLDAHKVLDDTVVIVTSDHGENLGEAGLLGHAFSLDDRLVRVPFVTNTADLLAGSGAKSLADLPSALCGLAGIDEHPYDETGSVDGVAVAELQGLVTADDPRVADVMERWGLGEEGCRRLSMTQWCATDGRYKLVRTGDHEALYDVVADPLELEPLSPDSHPDLVRRLRRVGDAVEGRRWDGLVGARQGTTNVELAPGELDALEEQMRRLGYL
ncbi:MAG: sulfatase-like hydrolase/transferase [Acidimicrobiales bacterium]